MLAVSRRAVGISASVPSPATCLFFGSLQVWYTSSPWEFDQRLHDRRVLPPSQNIEYWSVQILCQNIRSWMDSTKFNEVGE
jgi:hypothetical protein